jgi:3-hydroxyisobutyrate dehydrogenase-like beta-hydroxyacid dehydrogenase
VLEAGAEPIQGLADLRGVEAVLIVVNNMDQVNEVVLGNDGLVASFADHPLPLLVIMSTVSPEDVQGLEKRLSSHQAELLDAPISGGPFLAELGRLAIMVGGPEQQFARVRPALDALGEQVFHLGPLGSGMAMKLVNNQIGLASMMVALEALALGVEHQLDVDRMVEVINASSGKTFITENWPLIKGFLQAGLGDEDPFDMRGALFKTGLKDLLTAKSWAEGTGFATPVLDKLLEALSLLDEETFVARVRAIIGDTSAP